MDSKNRTGKNKANNNDTNDTNYNLSFDNIFMGMEESSVAAASVSDSLNLNFNTTDSYYTNFDSFVDPSMLMASDEANFGTLSAGDLAVMDGFPAQPSEIPPSTPTTKGPGSLYDKLTYNSNSGPTTPLAPMLSNSAQVGSPLMYPYGSGGGSPYSMGSPSSLAISSSEPSWMHSNRPRRRRSNYVSPSLHPQQQNAYLMSPNANQMALGFNAMNYPGMYANPMMPMSPQMQMYPHHPAYMMTGPMSPMNVTVKLPMAPLTPTNNNSGTHDGVAGSTKIPLVLPCHLQSQINDESKNSVAPNISSKASSNVPSRCSSIAPNSSISSRSATTNTSQTSQNWFTEMSATKDRFLGDVRGLDFNNVTVVELKQILRKFGLNSTGKKVQLVQRITEISNYLKAEGNKRAKISPVVTPFASAASVASVASETSSAVSAISTA